MKYSALLLAMAVAGCASPKPEVIIQREAVETYPNLPPMEAPNFEAKKFRLDVPRDMSAAPVVKQDAACKAVPANQRNAAFWKRCGEQPPLADSNIFIGMDEENFRLFEEFLEVMAAKDAAWKARLDEVNKQRAEWRAKNEAAIVALGAAPATEENANDE